MRPTVPSMSMTWVGRMANRCEGRWGDCRDCSLTRAEELLLLQQLPPAALPSGNNQAAAAQQQHQQHQQQLPGTRPLHTLFMRAAMNCCASV